MLDFMQALDERISIVDNVASWENAIRTCGKMLLEDGVIGESFIEKMVEAAKKLGPYIAIAPGIAVPHARPEDGAKAFGIAALVIKSGVNFNSHNDPVYLVIAFATPDSTSHIKFLQQLAEILQSSTDIVNKIKNCNTPSEVQDVLNVYIHKTGEKTNGKD